jgi:hypothetical protein
MELAVAQKLGNGTQDWTATPFIRLTDFFAAKVLTPSADTEAAGNRRLAANNGQQGMNRRVPWKGPPRGRDAV